MATQVGVGWRGALQQQQQQTEGSMRTRDLLGGSGSGSGSSLKEIDIDLDVEPQPQIISLSLSGWEKRLDMKSGKVYFHNCNNAQENTTPVALHDLNFPPSYPLPVGDSDGNQKFCELEWLCRVTGDRIEDAAVRPLEELNFMGKATNDDMNNTNENEAKLNLKVSNDSEWQSVCTLDKVKMALKRAEKDSGKRKKSSPSHQIEFGQSSWWGKTDRSPSLSSSSCSSLGLSLHNSNSGEWQGGEGEGALQAAGCPRCLVYVLLPKANPKCPRCGFLILLNTDFTSFKRPRLHTPTDTQEEAHSTVKSASSLPFDLNSVM